MNALVNKVQLIGNLGQDPTTGQTQKGRVYTRFSIATNEVYTSEGGVRNTKTSWHNVTAWGPKAEFANKYLKKGTRVLLQGKLVNSSYDDKQGIKRYRTSVEVVDLMKLDGKKAQEVSAAPTEKVAMPF